MNKFFNQSNFKINYLLSILLYSAYLLYDFEIYLFIFVIVLFLIPYINIGKEIKKNHGIETQSKSRLGGMIILITFIAIYLTNYELNFDNLQFENLNFFIIVMLAISLLGFVDDILGKLGHLIRLYFNIFAIFILLYTNEIFLFDKTNFETLNLILGFKIFSFVITIFTIVGFINACNISDGANGILSGIAALTFLIFYYETESLMYLSFFKIILFFFIYNFVICKVYLGDAGSYLLGYLISVNSLYLYNTGLIPAGLLASILCYPSIEVLMTIIRRISKFNNPFLPDNNHLHNLIHNRLNQKELYSFNTNSLTGLIIIIVFAMPSLFLYMFFHFEFNFIYWIMFIVQIFFYIVLYKFLK
tara:strand:+ start:135 stop:1214 length:1080 start_codon:yes stop_codon:yes gene_type:complete